MAYSVSSVLLLLCLCFNAQAILSIAAAPPSNDPTNLIEFACDEADYQQFCVDLLTHDRNTAKSDLKGFTFIALRAAEKNATAASVFVKKSLDNPDMDSNPKLQQALSDCSEHYITAVELIEDSVSALISSDAEDLVKFVKAAMADIDTCNDGLKGGRDVVTVEVTQRNSAIRKMFVTSLDIAGVANSKTPT